MTTYEFRVTILQSEEGDEVPEAPELPVWSQLDLLNTIGSFHEWMNATLSHEQRLAVRFDLVKVDDPDPGG